MEFDNSKDSLLKIKRINNFNNYVFKKSFKNNFSVFIFFSDNDYFLFFSKIFKILKFSGKICLIRKMGAIYFINLVIDNFKYQLVFKKKKFGKINNLLINEFSIGDYISILGFFIKTKTSNFTIEVLNFFIISKNCLFLPEKFHGLKDIELRYRYRYLDFFFNEFSKNRFFIKYKVVNIIREYFNSKNYIEVETPILVKISGGANASTFKTFSNAINFSLVLRIATELNLKKIISGGFSKIYEIGKIFRNESIDSTHNPEFTSIEFYQSFLNYKDFLFLIEDLLKKICFSINGNLFININNINIDFSFFKKDSIFGLFIKYLDLDNILAEKIKKDGDIFKILEFIILNKIEFLDFKNYLFKNFFKFYLNKEKEKIYISEVKDYNSFIFFLKDNYSFFFIESIIQKGFFYLLINYFYEVKIESTIVNPTFVYGFSYFTNPLSKKNFKNFFFLDRFELICSGMEIANFFTELIDPYEQYIRLNYNNDNNLNYEIDFDFLNSLKFGLPLLVGSGIGIDRLAMLFTNTNSIKDILFFPMMK